MEVEVLRLDDKYLELRARGDTYTLFSPIVEYLSNDPQVEYVQLDVDHPLMESVYFKMKTRGGNPLEILQKTIDTILTHVEELERGFVQ